MNLPPISNCCGCMACVAACPSHALRTVPNNEGFLQPEVDEKLCTGCKKCMRVCETAHKIHKNSQPPQKVMLAWARDEKIRKASSSGGIFSLLANDVLAQGGKVCGAAFDEAYDLRHVLISHQAELPKLRGSKYVQSNAGIVFPEIQACLRDGVPVLFCGTPCQVAGLKAFLGKKSPLLLTVDVLCMGVASPAVFKGYLHEVASRPLPDDLSIAFRNKCSGWKNFSFSIHQQDTPIVCEQAEKNIYFSGFNKSLFNRSCCSSCPYASIIRVGDLTLGDFWGLPGFKPQIDDDCGASLVLVNSPEGARTFKKITTDLAKCEPVPPAFAQNTNISLKQPCPAHPMRAEFFANKSNAKSWQKRILDGLNGIGRHVGILNFCFGNGYGEVLMSFATQKVLKKLGYGSEIINFHGEPVPLLAPLEKFRSEFLTRTKICSSYGELQTLNSRFGIFLVGSDQIWRWHYQFKYFLNWAHGLKNFIAYAISFGLEHFVGDAQETAIAKELVDRFDSLSVREYSGQKIMQQAFGRDAEFVLDPTLLLEAGDYQEILDKAENLPEAATPSIAYYFINDRRTREFESSSLFARLKARFALVNLRQNFNQEPLPVAHWLHQIKSADHVFTDSFHCAVFSLHYRTPIVCITRDEGGNERIYSMFELFSINTERIKSDFDFAEQLLDMPFDWNTIEKTMRQQRELSLAFLKNALAKKPNPKQYVPENFGHSPESFFELELKKRDQEIAQLREENMKLKALVDALKIKNKLLINKE